MQIAQAQGLAVGFGGLYQGLADFHAEVIAPWLLLGQLQQKAAAGAADVEVDGPRRFAKELGRWGQRQRPLVDPTERVDVLAHQAGWSLPWGTRKAQLAV